MVRCHPLKVKGEASQPRGAGIAGGGGFSRLILCTVKISKILFSLLFLETLLAPGLAHADCADAPAPKVDWGRCILDGRDFRGVDFSGVYLRDVQALRADFSQARLVGVDATRIKLVTT